MYIETRCHYPSPVFTTTSTQLPVATIQGLPIRNRVVEPQTSDNFPISKLPLEIRLKIWRCLLPFGETLVLDVNKLNETSCFKYKGKLPITLHICQESREETIRYFRFIPSGIIEWTVCRYCGSTNCSDVRPHKIPGYIERVVDNPRCFDISDQIIFMEWHKLHYLKAGVEKTFREGNSWPEAYRNHWISRKKNAENSYSYLENVRFLAIGGPLNRYPSQKAGIIFARFQKLETLWMETKTRRKDGIPNDYLDTEVVMWYRALLSHIRPFKAAIHKAWAAKFAGGVEQEQGPKEEGFAYFLRLRENGIPLPMIKSMELRELKDDIGLPLS